MADKRQSLAAACEQAAIALRSIQSITSEDVQRIAATTSNTSDAEAENLTSIRAELAQRFPSYRPSPSASGSGISVQGKHSDSNRQNKKRTWTTRTTTKRGRPSTSNIVYRDLVIIPNPETKKVPTHKARVALEKNRLIVSGFPFDRSWDAATLKCNIELQLPKRHVLFEYMKVRLFGIQHICIHLVLTYLNLFKF